MKPIRSIIGGLFVLSMATLQAQLPQVEWALQTEGAATKALSALTVDGDGNTIIAITSSEDFTFAGEQVTNGSLLPDAFGSVIKKIDASGIVLWTRAIRGPVQSAAICRSIATDHDNNIYVAFRGSADTDNVSMIGGLTIESTEPSADFLVKLDADGNGLWYRVTNDLNASASITSSPVVSTSPDGGIYRCGSFSGIVDFYSSTLVNQGVLSTYLIKEDAEGNTLWAKLITSPGGRAGGVVNMITDSDGSLYLSGFWEGNLLLIDGLSLINDLGTEGINDRWICKIAPDGTVAWLVREHSEGNDAQGSLVLTPEGHLLVMSTKGDADLFVGDFAVIGAGTALTRYDANGLALSGLLLNPAGGGPSTIAGDGNGAYFLAGSYNSAVFSLGGLQVENVGGPAGTSDCFIAKINGEGQAEWIYSFGSFATENSRFMDAMGEDRFVVGGAYNGIALDIQGNILLNLTGSGFEHFIASFSTSLATRTAEALRQLMAYPNPFTETVQLDTEALGAFQNATLVVYSTNGAEVYRAQLQGNDAAQLNLSHLPKGSYIARLSDGAKSLHTKIVKL